MEWTLASASPGTVGVPVPDDLAGTLIDAIDRPPGTFRLDPYADRDIPADRIAGLLDNLERARAERHKELRSSTARRLGLREWQHWAEPALATARERDAFLQLLDRLSELGRVALAHGRGMRVWGD